jgi:salicylate hydroxylase
MAIEDAAAFSIVFSKKNFNGDVRQALEVYQDVRKPRATKVQAASVRAMSNMHERIGFSSNTDDKHYKVADEKSKLTIEEMNEYDMHAHVESELVTRRRRVAQQEIANTSRVLLQTALRV